MDRNKLYNEYYDWINGWDWDATVEEAKANPGIDIEGNRNGYSFLGSVFAIMPSGKYYTPWANSNVTEEEAERDEIFGEALELIASVHGGWIESGEGDPCDIFFAISLEERPETSTCELCGAELDLSAPGWICAQCVADAE